MCVFLSFLFFSFFFFLLASISIVNVLLQSRGAGSAVSLERRGRMTENLVSNS